MNDNPMNNQYSYYSPIQTVNPLVLAMTNNYSHNYHSQQFNVGDIITRSKDVFLDHYGIIIENNYFGQTMVAENQFGIGPRLVTLSEFLQGQPIKSIEPFTGNEYERFDVINRYNNINTTNYHLLGFNCEHYARYIQTGNPKSKQVNTVKNLALVVGLIWLLRKN